ncbi:MAG TPA: MMPL family transporter [Nocardioidaceae bacterium]|nr:MMPL family transporter [Nocardioidaceae bacterium]
MPTAREVDGAGRAARLYARTVVGARYFIVLGWLAVAFAMFQFPAAPAPEPELQGFVADDSAAVRAETESVREFGFPLIARTAVVQRDPDGLSPYAQARAVLRAIALGQGRYPEAEPVVGALPVPNTLALFPSSSENGTTVVTFTFAPPSAGLGAQTRATRRFAEEQLGPEDAYVGVTGSIPARVAQARIVREKLPLMETATLIVVVSIVAVYFRSLTAPLVALVTAGLAFFLAIHTASRVGQVFEVTLPHELEPLILALVLGVVTDYAIFFLAGMRRQLATGLPRLDAARAAAASTGPIVAVASVTVALGTAVLVVAESALFQAFGPALALAVGVAGIVALTLVPALLAIFGRLLFLPGHVRQYEPRRIARTMVRLMVMRPVGAILAALCVVGLGLVGAQLTSLRPAVSFVPSLPPGDEVRTAAAAAAEGFAPGILSPTLLLARGDGVAEQRDALAELGTALARQPGVAGVVGPGQLPGTLERGVLLARDGDAARFMVILTDEPLGATAVETVERLEDTVQELGTAVGLRDVSFGLGGDTALAAELVNVTRDDLGRIAFAALVANFVVLVLFLRALVAPVFLLGASVLGLAAALGALAFVFQGVLGQDGVTFYVPFAAAVLLLSLGSDYNIFGVGYIWESANRMPLREAIKEAVPGTSSAITAAAVTLAASFSMLAIVPLRPFRELAFVMAVGILLDAMIVRSVLVPSVVSLLGSFSRWPRRRTHPAQQRIEQEQRDGREIRGERTR